MPLLDSHCHIYDEAFKDDLDEVLNRMVEAGITKTMICCCNKNEYLKAKEIKHPLIHFDLSIGIHPEDVKKMDEVMTFDELLEIASQDDIKAVGEIGLDYYWDKDNKEAQKEVFIRQIELAKKLHKPVIVHSRDANQDTFDILDAYHTPGVLHSYAGSKEMALEYQKRGYYLSFGGVVTYKNAINQPASAKAISLDNILIETDSPYLPPVPFRGKRNEPAYVKYAAMKICELRGISMDELLTAVYHNYTNLFGE